MGRISTESFRERSLLPSRILTEDNVGRLPNSIEVEIDRINHNEGRPTSFLRRSC